MRDGYQLRASGVPPEGNMIRVIARDPATGVFGTLTILLPSARRITSSFTHDSLSYRIGF
jgi:hypothetical protein